MLIATKARFPMGEGPNDRGLSRWHLIRECEASLKRLKTDVIDLYQVHQWDGLTPLEETMERSTVSCARARCATSAARTGPAGM
jgi:aryl-alcohol dehydrogenase-like predicted oxidoreductase